MADKASIVHWKELHTWKKTECIKLQKLIEGKDIVLKTQQIQIHDLEQQLDEVNRELTGQRDLEHQVRALTRVEDELRLKERQLELELSSLQVRIPTSSPAADNSQNKLKAYTGASDLVSLEKARRHGRIRAKSTGACTLSKYPDASYGHRLRSLFMFQQMREQQKRIVDEMRYCFSNASPLTETFIQH